MTRTAVQVSHYPGQDYQYQPQVPQSTAGPGRGPAEYDPSSNAHAGMNGYHNPEAGNPSPAANYSPDPGAVAEELLQVRQTDTWLVSRVNKYCQHSTCLVFLATLHVVLAPTPSHIPAPPLLMGLSWKPWLHFSKTAFGECLSWPALAWHVKSWSCQLTVTRARHSWAAFSPYSVGDCLSLGAS